MAALSKTVSTSTRTSTKTGAGFADVAPPATFTVSDPGVVPAAPYRPPWRYLDACRYDRGGPEPATDGSTTAPYFPYRPLYIAARWANVVLALVLFALSFVAERVIHRASWMNPILTTSLTAMGNSLFDLFFVHARGTRRHPHVRIVYDGVCLGTGLAVASGFLASWATADFQRTAPDATAQSAAVAAVILIGMFGMMYVLLWPLASATQAYYLFADQSRIIQFGFGLNGVHQVVQMHRGTWLVPAQEGRNRCAI